MISTAICVIVVILLVWILLCSKEDNYKRYCSDTDDRCYPVVTSFDSSTIGDATELLAYLNKFSITIIKHMRDQYLWKDHNDMYKTKMAKFILRHYDPDAIIENNPSGTVNTSYVEDKGKVLAVCLREKISGMHKLHEKHELEFVVLHELAHMTNHATNHSEEFWKDFKILMIEANRIGLHKPVNYQKYPFNYCSVVVDYNPYYDDSIVV